MRQVIDLADFDNSTWVNLTGNSGHAYNSNYSNQIDAWRDGAQFDWAFSSEAVQKATVDTLTLKPVTN
jgi:penicillin amidase